MLQDWGLLLLLHRPLLQVWGLLLLFRRRPLVQDRGLLHKGINRLVLPLKYFRLSARKGEGA